MCMCTCICNAMSHPCRHPGSCSRPLSCSVSAQPLHPAAPASACTPPTGSHPPSHAPACLQVIHCCLQVLQTVSSMRCAHPGIRSALMTSPQATSASNMSRSTKASTHLSSCLPSVQSHLAHARTHTLIK